MIPIPTSRVFRSRRGALMWSFWVLVATVMAVGVGDAPSGGPSVAAHSSDAPAAEDAELKALMTAMNAMNAT